MKKKIPLVCDDDYCVNLPTSIINQAKLSNIRSLKIINPLRNKDFINLSLLAERWKNNNNKIFEELELGSKKIARYKTIGLLDTGSQVSLIDPELIRILKANDQIEHNNYIKVRDLTGDSTNALSIKLKLKFRNINGDNWNFFIIPNLERRIGAPVLIGLDIIKKEYDITGSFDIFPKRSERLTIKYRKMKNHPVSYLPNALKIKKSFKEFGNFEDVAEKFGISINKVYDAIYRNKRFKNDAQYCCWILKQQSALDPNWWDNCIQKFSVFFSIIDNLELIASHNDKEFAQTLILGKGKGNEKRSFSIKEKLKNISKIVGEKSKDIKERLKATGQSIKRGGIQIGQSIRKGTKKVGKSIERGIKSGASKLGESISKAKEYTTKKIKEGMRAREGIFIISMHFTKSPKKWTYNKLMNELKNIIIP
ncbi:MAG: retropepsin-like aspartic protease, partial [Promethearchaeia archaeon]